MSFSNASSYFSPSLDKKSQATVIKSPNDENNYRVIVLKNGLRAILISDLDDDEALEAAATTLGARGGVSNFPIKRKRKMKNNQSKTRVLTASNQLRCLATVLSDQSYCGTSSDWSSDLSENEYEEVHLLDNRQEDLSYGLEEAVSVAAAALCLGVGSYADPDNLPGLAHFVEHMVFMGSEEYPDENYLDTFLSKHGGFSNAETGPEDTIFYFEVLQKHLSQALEIFAQFFICPLMKKDCIDRELQSIENEFRDTAYEDTMRMDRLLRNMAKPGHPMGKFTFGNEYTLKTQACERGIDIYEKCREFHCRYYSAHYMTLAVQARAKLDDIETLVKRIFGNIPNNGLPRPTFYHFGDPFDTVEFRRFYRVVPIQDSNKLRITWSLPYMSASYRNKALHYLSYLSCHQGAGSIYSYLKKKLWAEEVVCIYERKSAGFIFYNEVTLTDTGLCHVYEVITVVFEYFEMLRAIGPSIDIHSELSRIQKNVFDWKPAVAPVRAVQKLAEHMHLYKPEDYLRGGTLMFEYEPELIKHYLQLLTPARCNVMVQSKSFDKPDVYDIHEEIYYSTRYSVTDIESCWLSKWKQLSPRPELHLPSCNPFVATSFDVVRDMTEKYERPHVIQDYERTKVWYHQDWKIFKPCGHIYLRLMSTATSATKQGHAMFDLFVEILTDSFRETVYLAGTAALDFLYYWDQTGLCILLSGFNDKLPKFYQAFIDCLVELTVDDEWFAVIKERLMKKYYNSLINREILSKDLLRHISELDMWSLSQRRAALRTVKKNEFLEFVATFFETIFIEGYVYGNVQLSEATEIARYLDRKFSHIALSSTRIPEPTPVQIPKGTRYCRVSNINTRDTNSYVLNYYEIGPCTIHDAVLTELLVRLMTEQCFEALRIKEQLCYDVVCFVETTGGIIAIVIAMNFQSTKYSARYADDRIEYFLSDFEKVLGSWQNEDFRPHLEALIAEKESTECLMEREAQRNWIEITDRTYFFDKAEIEAKEAAKVTLKELQSWYQRAFSKSHRRKLSIQIVGSNESAQSQRVPKCLSPDDEHANDCSRSSQAGRQTTKALQYDDLLLSDSPSTDWKENCEYEYLQDEQSEGRKDPKSIDDPVAFKNSLPLYPTCKLVNEYPLTAERTRK